MNKDAREDGVYEDVIDGNCYKGFLGKLDKDKRKTT